MRPATFVVTVTVMSKTGKKPVVRCLGGGTIFVWLDEGQSARWSTRKKRGPKNVSAG
jgi:hypothetical protein